MRTLVAVLVFCLAGCATVVAGFINMKRDIADHSAQLAAIQQTISVDHDIGVQHTIKIETIAKTVDRIERKLDQWSGPPTIVTTTTTTAVKPN